VGSRAQHNIPIGAALVVDANGVIVGWNEGAQSVLGFAAADVVGHASHLVLCGRNPRGRLICHPWCAWSSGKGRVDSNSDLVLYPRTLHHTVVQIRTRVFCIPATDSACAWAVHVITAARPLPIGFRPTPYGNPSWLRRRPSKLAHPPER
jgi:PAS domain-containing protein